MTEGVFILTALFVAYVIYVIVNEKKAGGESTKPAPAATQAVQQTVVAEKPKAVAKPAAAKKAPAKAAAKPVPAKLAAVQEAVVAKPAAVVEKKTAAAKPVAAAQKPAVAKLASAQKSTVAKPVASATKQKPAEPSAPEATAVKGAGLKDPKTGEVATAYGNYRFAKRWIKEALVSEKLVDKVYKNDELNASVEAKIKAGIVKLEGMKKYQP